MKARKSSPLGPRHGSVTEGARGTEARGSMQDYNYIYAGCMELTLEISCCKFPDQSYLKHEWTKNKNALIELYKKVHIGVKGVVLGAKKTPIKDAQVSFIGRDHPSKTTKLGEFWRLLLPGTYTIKIEHEFEK
ncbi:hypothetical protein HELRODRAFT_194815 [Helobdella robusta]|uniref:Peptidase M14 domain-containing protein n=1 Tax=Helobdella robusta TaxID=6412 RepID=T1FWG2_HELRO|nr:hypothetical protein HELRODRAFT_194815 [Helobdella robusta]ESO11435.1 hypothetical protein HELRODRAFT_194815 [Helobdella robusta]